ncbi:hypothetical protein S1OALGB6SA_1832 [Olavius algarvensis spirochete endosymbiont]|nr:hypothetical protein S1OALGB6SA_1832 [Olavius algarvensis spirochete endosymbiont]
MHIRSLSGVFFSGVQVPSGLRDSMSPGNLMETRMMLELFLQDRNIAERGVSDG